MLDKILEFLKEYGVRLALSLAAILMALIVILVVKIISIKIKKKVDERAQNITIIIYTTIKYIILVVALLIILSIWNFDDANIATIILGIVVAIIGLSLIPIIQDLFYGISNIFSAEYKVGDIVEINGFTGKVVNFTLVKTKIQASTGETRTFANSLFKEFTNYSQDYYTASISIEVTELNRLEEIMRIIDETLPEIKEEYKSIIEGPNLTGIEKFSNGVATIKIVAKVNYEDYNKVMKGLQEYVLKITVNNEIK